MFTTQEEPSHPSWDPPPSHPKRSCKNGDMRSGALTTQRVVKWGHAHWSLNRPRRRSNIGTCALEPKPPKEKVQNGDMRTGALTTQGACVKWDMRTGALTTQREGAKWGHVHWSPACIFNGKLRTPSQPSPSYAPPQGYIGVSPQCR